MKKNGKKIFGLALLFATVAVTAVAFVHFVKSLASVLEGAMTVSGRCYDDSYHKEE